MTPSTLHRLWILATCWLALAGCAVSPTTTDGAALQPNEGLLVFHVGSNSDALLSYVDYAEVSTFISRLGDGMGGERGQLRIKSGDTFYVVPLAAGEYMFSKFHTASGYDWLQATNRFRVQANTITYIGHIAIRVDVRRYSIQVRDREPQMRTYLANTYPVYFKGMDFQKKFAELKLR
ncbi:MAG: hypothetical protein EOO24_26050 [Comamonadaceae bacterium]|nr:MAG: hypothetical protein EOO24_26050 [Comamonadaceae bacterium]